MYHHACKVWIQEFSPLFRYASQMPQYFQNISQSPTLNNFSGSVCRLGEYGVGVQNMESKTACPSQCLLLSPEIAVIVFLMSASRDMLIASLISQHMHVPPAAFGNSPLVHAWPNPSAKTYISPANQFIDPRPRLSAAEIAIATIDTARARSPAFPLKNIFGPRNCSSYFLIASPLPPLSLPPLSRSFSCSLLSFLHHAWHQ